MMVDSAPHPEKKSLLVRFRFCLALLLVAVSMFLRKPQAFLLPQFWAEDATVFFRENVLYGPFALIETYAGYFHLLPRLIAWLGGFLPYEAIPAFYNFAALSVFLLTAGVFLSGRLNPIQVLGLIAVSVLVPHDGECFVNLTNLQWMIGPFLLLYAIQPPAQTVSQKIGDIAGILLIGLTGPFILFCLPVFVWRFFQNRKITSELIAAIFAAAIQGGALFLHAQSVVAVNLAWSDLGITLFSRFTGVWFGSLNGLFPRAQLFLAAALLVLFVSLCLKGVNRFFYLAAAVYAITEITAALIKNHALLKFLAVFGNGERYFYFVYVLIGWMAVVALSEKVRLFQWSAAMILLLLFISSANQFRAPNWPDLKWNENAARLRSEERFTIQLNPSGWGLRIDKNRLEAIHPNS